jgi:hypothetical protein
MIEAHSEHQHSLRVENNQSRLGHQQFLTNIANDRIPIGTFMIT